MRPFIKSESWPIVGFCPHVTSTGVFGINLSTLYPNFGSFEGGVQHNEPDNRTIGLYHSHLAIGIRVWSAQPLVFGRPHEGLYKHLIGRKTRSIARCIGYGIMQEKSLKILQPLEQLTSSRRIMTVSFRLSLLSCSFGITRAQLQ